MPETLIDSIVGENRDRFTARVELVGKLVLWTAAACYGIGLVIVNGYLMKYGVQGVTLLRSDYVLAGLLWLVLTGIGSFSILWLNSTWRSVKRAWAAGRRFLALTILLLGAIATPSGLMFPVMMLSGLQLSWDKQQFWFVIGAICATSAMLCWAGRTIVMNIRGWRSKGAIFSEFPTHEVAFQCFFAIASLGLYSGVVYPSLPQMYGGGRPTTVRLIPTTGSAEVLRVLSGKGPEADGLIFLLVAETGDWLVLLRHGSVPLSSGAGAIRVRRDMVAAIERVPSVDGR